ncbi:MAG TPA: helix-turn-helix domain-containing protein [Gemmatimonadaceae bacterium]
MADELLTLEEVKRQHVLAVLDACGGNRANTARALGVDRKTLYRWLVDYGVIARSVTTHGRVRFSIATSKES